MVNKTLGQYLKELRKSFEYTQEYVASELGVSRQAYSHYENGRAIPTNDTFYKLAQLYNVSAEMLIELSLQANENILNEDTQLYRIHNKTELDKFLEYIGNPERYKNLSNREKQILYHFNSLPTAEQDEILEIIRIKIRKHT